MLHNLEDLSPERKNLKGLQHKKNKHKLFVDNFQLCTRGSSLDVSQRDTYHNPSASKQRYNT